jgi:hemerythrin superfamily protein
MTEPTFSRRALGAGVAGLAAIVAMRRAVAQTAMAGGTWLDMVKRHHGLIVATFDRILATNDGQAAERAALQKRLAYLLTAHSVAEENVLYPALARIGMTRGSDQLYMEQAHAKVINADLELSAKGTSVWLRKVSDLKTALVHHAKDEEEDDLYPKLMSAAGSMNGKLTSDYAHEFSIVQRS